MGVGGPRHSTAALALAKNSGTLKEDRVGLQGPFWTSMEKRKFFVPTGVLTTNRPFRIASLYRLRYFGCPGKAISHVKVCQVVRSGLM